MRVIQYPDTEVLNSIRAPGSYFLTFPNPLGRQEIAMVSFRSLQTSGRLRGTSDVVRVTVAGAGYLIEGPDITTDGREGPGLVAGMERDLAQRIRRLLEPLYSEGLDILDLGEQLRRQSRNGKVPPDWDRRMRQLTFEVDARISLLHGQRGR